MPYTDKQVRLFQGVKHGTIHRKGMTPGKAAKMLSHENKRKAGVAARMMRGEK